MRVFILCGGSGSRWQARVPKHLVKIDGERLLDRTVGQLERGGVRDIHVVAPNLGEYAIPGTTLTAPVDGHDTWKVDSVCHMWHSEKRIVLLCGDVYFTALAMERILLHEPRPFAFFGRRQRSKLTGGKWGEIFGLSVAPGAHEGVVHAAKAIREKVQAGELERGKMWEVFQYLIGAEPNPYGPQVFDHHWVDIDDWTEDFDTVEEFEEWTRRRS